MPPLKALSVAKDDVTKLATQVAGHNVKEENSPQTLLKHKDGYVLKYVSKLPKGAREVEFYSSLASSQYSDIRNFFPKFYGTAVIGDSEFLMLEDLTQGFEQPCVMDIKIGRQTWDPLASAEKIKSEKEKYVMSKTELGFCIPGFQVYDIESKNVLKFDKHYGKLLNKDGVKQAFRIFLNMEKCASGKIIRDEVLTQVEPILRWMSSQKELKIFSSSILIVYDCAQLLTKKKSNEWIRVRMIDCAHVFSTPDSHERDENYLTGLDNLVNLLKELN